VLHYNNKPAVHLPDNVIYCLSSSQVSAKIASLLMFFFEENNNNNTETQRVLFRDAALGMHQCFVETVSL